jgi:transcriptional regulator with XRE-family HTH domain
MAAGEVRFKKALALRSQIRRARGLTQREVAERPKVAKNYDNDRNRLAEELFPVRASAFRQGARRVASGATRVNK